RYVMQLFATVIDYADFLPYHQSSEQCDDHGIDSFLAYAATVLFYLMAIPVLLLMIRVLMPRLPKPLPFVSASTAVTTQDASKKWTTRLEALADRLNPIGWVMAGVHRLMVWQLKSLSNDVATPELPVEEDKQDNPSPPASTATYKSTTRSQDV